MTNQTQLIKSTLSTMAINQRRLFGDSPMTLEKTPIGIFEVTDRLDLISLDNMTVIIADQCFDGDVLRAAKFWARLIKVDGIKQFSPNNPLHIKAMIAACKKYHEVNIHLSYNHLPMTRKAIRDTCRGAAVDTYNLIAAGGG